MDIFATLKEKVGGIPIWVITLLGVGALALRLTHNKGKQKTASTANAAAQTSTNLGSAGQLANMFDTAGLMPFQGGNTYVNTAQPAAPDQPVVVNVGHNQPVQEIINWAKKNGYPNYTWADFWAMNPQIAYSGKQGVGDLQNVNNNWILTDWSTPVTIYKPGTLQNGGAGISGDYSGKPTF